MKTGLIKFLGIILCLVFVVGLIGCSDKNDNAGNNNDTSKKQQNEGSSNEDTATLEVEVDAEPLKGPLEKYEPAIEVTTVHTNHDSQFWFDDGDSINENIYTRTWEEELGIKYKFLWTSPSAQGEQKMNLTIASGDLPDVMSVSLNDYQKLYAAGMLADLTQPIIDHASKYSKQFFAGDNAMLAEPIKRDGRYYGIPNGFAYQDTGNMLWVRAEWLANVNMEAPETIEELEALMDAFVNDDPNQSGTNDTYAIALAGAEQGSQDWGIGEAFFNSFHSYPNLWVKNSEGNLEHGMFGDEQRENTQNAIEKLREYYELGYLHEDFFTFGDAQSQEEMFNDKAGILVGELWGAYWPLVQHLDIDSNADWIPVAIPSSDGQPAKMGTDAARVDSVLVARKDFEHPEALIKMVNLYHNLNNNPETMEFAKYNVVPEDGNQIFQAYPLQVFDPGWNYTGYGQISEALETGDSSILSEAYKLFYDQANDYKEDKAIDGWSAYRTYAPGGSMSVVDEYLQDKRMQMNEFTSEPTEFMLENVSTIKTLYDQMFITVVKGDADMEEYQTFLSQYDSIYGETAAKEVNEWFEAKNKESIQDWFENN